MITNDAEYNKTLSRVEELMDAEAGETENSMELQRLCASVEKYEDEHYPIAEPSASDAIKFRGEQEVRDET